MSCEKCVEGHLSEGATCGKIHSFGGVNAYISRPSGTAKNAVIISTDVFGYNFINAHKLADGFAKAGFLCVIPDLFNGDSVPVESMNTPEGRDNLFKVWIPKHSDFDKKNLIMHQTIKDLKEKEGIQKVGVIGYCYGAKNSVILASYSEGVQVDAYAVAHPSFLTMEDVGKIVKPGLYLCAETDMAFSNELKAQTKENLEKRGIKTVFRDFPGTQHGFAVRGDERDEVSARAKVDALEEAITYFKGQFN